MSAKIHYTLRALWLVVSVWAVWCFDVFLYLGAHTVHSCLDNVMAELIWFGSREPPKHFWHSRILNELHGCEMNFTILQESLGWTDWLNVFCFYEASLGYPPKSCALKYFHKASHNAWYDFIFWGPSEVHGQQVANVHKSRKSRIFFKKCWQDYFH